MGDVVHHVKDTEKLISSCNKSVGYRILCTTHAPDVTCPECLEKLGVVGVGDNVTAFKPTEDQMQGVLGSAEAMYRAGVFFVPMPVLSEEDMEGLFKKQKKRLRAIERE